MEQIAFSRKKSQKAQKGRARLARIVLVLAASPRMRRWVVLESLNAETQRTQRGAEKAGATRKLFAANELNSRIDLPTRASYGCSMKRTDPD
jgi:hypothetical protein